MQHLSIDETYNNKQVWKVLDRISAETCQKMDYFGAKYQTSPSALRPSFRFND